MVLTKQLKEELYKIDGREFFHSEFNLNWAIQASVEPTVIFDIGAYDCGDAIRFKNHFAHAEVYSFEADPERAKKIKEYIWEYRVNFYDHAISSIDGDIEFYPCVSDTFAQGSIYQHTNRYKTLYANVNQLEKIMIKSKRIDTFCEEKKITSIDIAHIDVEGAEMEVINGLGILRPKILYIETLAGCFDNKISIQEIHEKLVSLGYELIKDYISNRFYYHT